MKKNIILISFLLFITQAFGQTFQINIVPKIKKDSLYIAYVMSFDRFPSTTPTIGTIKIVVQLDEKLVDMAGGKVRRVSRYDRTNPQSGNYFRDNTVSYSNDRSIYTIMRNTTTSLSPYPLQNVNFDTLGVISYPLLTCERNMSITFDETGGTQTVIKTWTLGDDISKTLNLVPFNGTVPKERAPLTISDTKVCSGATVSLATSAKGKDYLLHTIRNGAVVGRSRISQTPRFDNLVADKDFASKDVFMMTFTNPYGCIDTTILKSTLVANCCDSSFNRMAPSYCISSFKVKLIPATPGGVFRGPGVYFNSALNTWIFSPSEAGPGTHKITYTLGANSLSCVGKSDNQVVVVNPAPCVAKITHDTTVVKLPKPAGIFTNCDGEIFASSGDNHSIYKIDTFGVRILYAGDSSVNLPKDGDINSLSPASRAYFCEPTGLIADSLGNFYVADVKSHSVVKINNLTGIASTIGGNIRDGSYSCADKSGAYVNGIRGVSRFNGPYGVALNESQDTLYVSEYGGNRIRGIELKSGLFQTFDVAGTGASPTFPVNGKASSATFKVPKHLSLKGKYLYVADYGYNMVRRIDLKSKTVITLAGKIAGGSLLEVDTSKAKIANPSSASADCEGNVYVVETSMNRVVRINQLNNVMTVTRFAGSEDGIPGDKDTSALLSTFFMPEVASIYSKGFIDVADQGNNLIRRVAIDDWSGRAFNGLEPIYCYNGPTDTLLPLQCSGTMTCSNPSLLQLIVGSGGRPRYAINPKDTGTFTMYYTYREGKCTQTLKRTFSIFMPKKPNLGNDLSFCDQNLKINLKNDPFVKYTWTRDNVPVAVPATQNFITVNQLAGISTTIAVSTVDENGCAGVDDLKISKASASFPKVDLIPSGGDTVVCKGSVVQLYAQFTPANDAPKFYKSWNTNNPSDTSQTINAKGSYKYVFTIADKNSPTCTKSFEKSLIVKEVPTGCYKLTNNVTGNEINLRRYSVSTLPNTMGNLKKPLDVVYRGGYLYIADSENHRVKRYNIKTGLMENFIGDGIDGATDSLPPLQTQLNYPSSLAFDAKGNLFICNLGGNYISKYDSIKKKVYVVAGNPGKIGFNDGEGINSRFNKPIHIEADQFGNIFVTDNLNNAIRKLSPVANSSFYKVVTYTGFSGVQGAKDGKPKVAQFDYPWGIASTSTGLVISEDLNHTIRKIGFDTLSTLYSGKFKTPDNVPVVDDPAVSGLDARFNKPWGLTVDKQGQIYVADGFNNNIKKIDKSGNVITIAGLGDAGSQDGDTYIATFNRPTAVALGPDDKTLYVSDRDNGSIREIKQDTVQVCESDFTDNMTYVNQCLDSKMTNKWYFSDTKVKDSLILSTTSAGGISITKPGLYVNEITEKLSNGCLNILRDSLKIKPKSTYSFKSNLAIGGGFSASNKYCPDQPLELKLYTVPAMPPSPSIIYRLTETQNQGNPGKLFPPNGTVVSNNGVFQVTPSFSLLKPGATVFYFRISVTDQDGCVHMPTGTATLRLLNTLPLEPIKDVPICLGDTVNIAAVQKNSTIYFGDSYFWWEPSDAIFGVKDEGVSGQNKKKSTAKISPKVTTIIKVKNSLPPGFNTEGCIDSTSFKVIVNPAPNVAVTPDTGLCGGTNTNIVLTASVRPPDDPSQYKFTWYNLAQPADSTVGATKTVAPLTTTKYKLKINSPTGCIAIDTTTVGVGQAPIAKIDAPTDNVTVCPHTNVQLQGSATGGQPYKTSPTYRYEWKNMDDNTSIATDNPHTLVAEKTIKIKLQVKDSIGCAGSDSVNVLVSSFKISDGQKDTTICEGTSFEAKAVQASGSTSYTYLWDKIGPLLSDPSIANPKLSPVDTLIPTSYVLKVTDNFNCELSDTVLVGVGTAPRMAALQAALDYCQAQSYTVSATAVKGQSPYTFVWSEPTGQNIGFTQSNQSTIGLVPNTAGNNFVVTVSVIDANQCKSRDTSRTFNVQTSPFVNFATDTVICNGKSVVLSAVFAENAGVNLDYAWYKDGNLLPNNTDQQVLDALGVYKAILTSEMGCSRADSIQVAVKDSIESINSIISGTCKGQDVKLLVDINKGTLGFNVKWATLNGQGTFDGSTDKDINVYKDSIIYKSSESDPDQIDFKIQVSNACNVVSSTSNQTLGASPKAIITSVTPSAYINQPVEFGQGATNYDALMWNFGDKSPLLNSNDSKVSHTYVDASVFTVVLYALNNNGCKDSTTVQVPIINNQNIYIPNVFNPTSSNPENSFVKVYGANITNSGFSFVIFNRWGQVVYETIDFSQANKIGWNGKLQNSGDELSLGAYTYLLKGKYGDGKEFEKVGTITLVK